MYIVEQKSANNLDVKYKNSDLKRFMIQQYQHLSKEK